MTATTLDKFGKAASVPPVKHKTTMPAFSANPVLDESDWVQVMPGLPLYLTGSMGEALEWRWKGSDPVPYLLTSRGLSVLGCTCKANQHSKSGWCKHMSDLLSYLAVHPPCPMTRPGTGGLDITMGEPAGIVFERAAHSAYWEPDNKPAGEKRPCPNADCISGWDYAAGIASVQGACRSCNGWGYLYAREGK